MEPQEQERAQECSVLAQGSHSLLYKWVIFAGVSLAGRIGWDHLGASGSLVSQGGIFRAESLSAASFVGK